MRGAAAALALLAAPAIATASDAASTDAYLRANYALVADGNSNIRSAEARLRALREQLRRECGGVVDGSPQDENANTLNWEAIGLMTITGYAPGKRAIATFARTIAPLHWSNSSLTREVHTYARQLKAEVLTPLPHLCADLRAWRASGYATLPRTTTDFRKSFYENYVGVGFLPLQKLGSRARAQASLVRRSQRYQLNIEECEAREVETYGAIIDLLGLKQ
jgi:hypothetical protein